MNQTEKKLYEAEVQRLIDNPEYQDKPLELFLKLVRAADTFRLMPGFCEAAGISRFSPNNWIYGGEIPYTKNFIKILSAMGFDVKIVRKPDVR